MGLRRNAESQHEGQKKMQFSHRHAEIAATDTETESWISGGEGPMSHRRDW